MLVRIENTGLTRGREFSLFAYGDKPNVVLYSYDSVTKSIQELEYNYEAKGKFHIFRSIAPSFDGYLLAKVGAQKLIKRIGNPFLIHFIYGYKPNYTIIARLYDIEAKMIKEVQLQELTDGFYAMPLTREVAMVEVRGKFFLINRNIDKLNYKISMEGGSLHSSYKSSSLPDLSIPEVRLENVELKSATLDSTMPKVTIEEL